MNPQAKAGFRLACMEEDTANDRMVADTIDRAS